MQNQALSPGFTDPVIQSQHIFHQTMMALANPGTVRLVEALIDAPQPLSRGAAALLLALADYETSVWCDAPLRAQADVAQFIRFHTGAKIVDAPDQAAFALVSAPAALEIGLQQFAQGNADYPDRSTTLILQLDIIRTGEGFSLSGPGIPGRCKLSFDPLLPDFVRQWQANHAAFPCGVDVFGVAGGELIGLPRSLKLEA